MTRKGLEMCAHVCTHVHAYGHTHVHTHTCLGRPPGHMHTPTSTLACTQHTWSRAMAVVGRGGSLWAPLGGRRSAEHRHAVCGEDYACGGLIGAREVVEALAVLVFLGLQHLFVLLQAHYQALVGHCLNIILIHM